MRASFAVFILAIASMSGTGQAAAEDFTGFYAGVNAGYGLGRDRQDGIAPLRGVDLGGKPGNGPSLPPSALSAAQTLRFGPRSDAATSPALPR